MKLYIQGDYKITNRDDAEIGGVIYSKPKDATEQIFIYFNAKRYKKSPTFHLELRNRPEGIEYEVDLDVDFECKMTLKDILYWVEHRIDKIWRK